MSHFNTAANTWDTPEKITLSANYAEAIKKYLPQNSNLKILELGCGTGLLGSQFVLDNNQLFGVDPSTGMLEVFKGKFADNKNVHAINLNLEEDDLDESDFNLLISSMAFHHLKSPKDILIKLKNHFKPNSILAIIDLDQEDGSFHPDPLKMGVYHSGFSLEDCKDWAKAANLTFVDRKVVHTIDKNEKSYPICLTILKN